MKHVYLAILANVLGLFASAQKAATFDDLNLAAGKFWNGSDRSGNFKSGDFTFYNTYYTGDWEYWSGFAYSSSTDATSPGFQNQYSAITGKGNNGSANYAVCYPSPSASIGFSAGLKVDGFFVTNSTYAYLSMKNGDQFAKKFGGTSGNDPDFLMLMIEAMDQTAKPFDTIYFYLADFRDADNSKDYILNKWTWVDLSGINAAQGYRFSLSSSDNSYGFMNTPGYFCIDDFNGLKPTMNQAVTFAGFENMKLNSSGYYNGNDLKGGFNSGNFRFSTNYNDAWGSWSGFAVSEKKDATTPGYGNQYSAITGGGVGGTPGYAVVYPVPVSTVTFKDTIVSGVYVTNSTYAYLSMKNGDQFSKKFGGESGNDSDWLILSIDGYNSENQSTGRVEFYLADFSYSINTNDYIINDWRWVDLRKLGRVSKLEFSLRSTDNSVWGMNTPGYFCMDNLNREALTSVEKPALAGIQVYPNPFTNRLVVNGIDSNMQLTLRDMTGKCLLNVRNANNGQVIEGLEHLKPGIYYLTISDGTRQSVSKLMKR